MHKQREHLFEWENLRVTQMFSSHFEKKKEKRKKQKNIACAIRKRYFSYRDTGNTCRFEYFSGKIRNDNESFTLPNFYENIFPWWDNVILFCRNCRVVYALHISIKNQCTKSTIFPIQVDPSINFCICSSVNKPFGPTAHVILFERNEPH